MSESDPITTDRTGQWFDLIDGARRMLRRAQPIEQRGRLCRVTGLTLEATGIELPIGSICIIEDGSERAGTGMIDAEVVGFNRGHLLLMPTQSTAGMSPGAAVAALEPRIERPSLGRPTHAWARREDRGRHLPIGPGLLGRIVDGRGTPMDGQGLLQATRYRPIRARAVNAMHRSPIREPLDTGVRAINTMLSVGRGQRLGLFAGAGVGKSVLLGMMSRNTDADVIVVGLIGERGREVREFVDDILGPSGRQRATVIVAPADEPALMKIQSATYAAAIAEFYRDQGLQVLLLMDSLTRYAMAMREVSLAAGESPATRGYPASVFARLPELIERAGNAAHGKGSITAFYTVLIEGDDTNDPVGDAARSFLDGHVVLSRELAEAGHFPAIAIDASISRVMTAITSPAHQRHARRLRTAWAAYQKNRELIALGAYVPGADPQVDQAIALWPKIEKLLMQDIDERCPLAESIADLARLAGELGDGSTHGAIKAERT